MLRQNGCLLAIVDIQGKLARIVDQSEAVIRQSCRLAQACRILEIPILLSQQCPDKLGPTVADLQSLLPDIEPINKSTFSCWPHPEFQSRLKHAGRSDIILCGIETHVCVYQTARDLLEQGYPVQIICDAVSSRHPLDKERSLELMRQLGARIVTLETLLFEILESADHPKFRDISKLVK